MRHTMIDDPVLDYGPRYLARLAILVTAILLLVFASGTLLAKESTASKERADTTGAYIVKGTSAERMAELVVEVGGKVTHELEIIRAVGAQLTDAQRDALVEHPEVARVWRDREAKVQSARKARE